MTRSATGSIEYEHEPDVDTATYTIEYRITPGEPMVMYDRNGEGYPGSADECEIVSVRLCERLYPEWKDVMERHFRDMIDMDDRLRESIEAACFEDANEQYAAAADAEYDSRRERGE